MRLQKKKRGPKPEKETEGEGSKRILGNDAYGEKKGGNKEDQLN